MALRIRLAPGEQLIVNGAVIQNGDRRNVISVLNPANVLRGRDVMKVEDAVTPAAKAYFLVQSVLIATGADRAGVRSEVIDLLAELAACAATEEERAFSIEAASQFTSDDYYKALAALRALLPLEAARIGAA